ncbi:ROK family protein [Oryzicola mucosus]|uniref:ROK family protein n=1 Tax=Oryzicola mucosus TaxID=2767425 RepID=A0A8J6PTE5_9HYPH|nr:ROK family protein [Oryzicola mucosus]MBD0415049.1 ROK family protein [Oryzicola mucosus]
MQPMAVSVDIGGTNLRAARVGSDGAILARARASSSSDPQDVLERLMSLIAEVDHPDVAAIGIGVPGRVDFAAQTMVSGGYVDLSKVPLASTLATRFARSVTIDNDATMALLGEVACGAARGVKNVVMLTIGTGIGGAILDKGAVLRGRMSAGQLGHIVVDPNGLQCLCGRRGCVETMSSGTALRRHIKEAGWPDDTTARILLDKSVAGDVQARAVLEAWAGPLRQALDSLVAAFDPELIVLGGGLGREAAEALKLIPVSTGWYRCDVAGAELGDDAGVIGAGLAALDALRPGKRLVMVNGVPASGKSTVAKRLSAETGWPLFALDTVKNPFLAEIGTVDRPFNRVLGRASYKAIFALIEEAPANGTFIVDAWFGFQPKDMLEVLIAESGIAEVIEIWCHADPDAVAARYRRRAKRRLPGHPGAEYADELRELATRAEPMRIGPVLDVDTEWPLDMARVHAFVSGAAG